jgi:hypothetical protein
MTPDSKTLLGTLGFACLALTTFTAAAQPVSPEPAPRGELRAEQPVPPKNEFYVVPEFGVETGVLSRGVYLGPAATTRNVGFATGIASLAFGLRFDNVNLGIRYQGSYAGKNYLDDLQFHKVYGELGFDWRRQVYVANLFFDFGYSGLLSTNTFLNGLGGKAGVAFDFYVAKWFSIGPVVSFDVQGFNTGLPNAAGNPIWVNTLGASIFGRLGFHI